jgi:hypothetical protein
VEFAACTASGCAGVLLKSSHKTRDGKPLQVIVSARRSSAPKLAQAIGIEKTARRFLVVNSTLHRQLRQVEP